MTTSLLVGVLVVPAMAAAEARIVRAIELAGATPQLWSESSAISKAGSVDMIVLALDSTPEELRPIVASLDLEPRIASIPRVLIVDDDVTVARIASFGSSAAIVTANAPDEALVAAIAEASARVTARADLQRMAAASAAAVHEREQLLASIQRDISALSHDVRVLLGVILGFAANLRDGIDGPVTEEQQQHLVSIVEATNDAVGLLERYAGAVHRAASSTSRRTPAPPAVMTRRQVDLAELVRTIVALFDSAAADKGVRLVAQAEVAVDAWCDPLKIKQALVNLVSNALKFTPTGGTVSVSVDLGQAASARGGATERRDVEIVVTDSGPGIPPFDRERVFQRGVRLDRDQEIPGSGQGLAIVRDIAELHGGFVRAEDGIGTGTAIVLVLPTDRRARGRDDAPPNSTGRPPRSDDAPPSSSRARWPELRVKQQ